MLGQLHVARLAVRVEGNAAIASKACHRRPQATKPSHELHFVGECLLQYCLGHTVRHICIHVVFVRLLGQHLLEIKQ
ncbi:hypothetical protein D3C87_2108030 [compost metagenome]